MARRSILEAADVQAEAKTPQTEEIKPAEPTQPGTDVALPEQSGSGPTRLREQPFSLAHWSATLPERDVTEEEAHGPLSPEEQDQLDECHRAVDNVRTAQWLHGRALEIVRRRRLFRGDGTRTWVQYLAAEHDGMSERDARRLMREWRLAKAVQEAVGKPAPPSHVRAMLDYADHTSNAQAANDYAQLRRAFEAGKLRPTAQQISSRVSAAIASAAAEPDPQQRQHAVTSRWQELQPVEQAPARLSKDTTASQPQDRPDPLVGAAEAVEGALERLNKALLDEGAAHRRALVEAEDLQKRLRKVGRVLTKVTVPADDIVDVEVVEDHEARG